MSEPGCNFTRRRVRVLRFLPMPSPCAICSSPPRRDGLREWHGTCSARGRTGDLCILRIEPEQAAPKDPMSASLVRMTVRWLVPLGESRPMSSALHTLMVAARAERGCLACSLSTELGDRAALHYVADWETEEDLQRQLRSDWFISFAALIERATSPPDVEFSVAGSMRGLDYVEEVRKQRRSS